MTRRSAVIIAIVTVIVIGAGAILGASMLGPRLFKAEQAVETQTDTAVGAGLEVEGERETAREAATFNDTLRQARERTYDLEQSARAAPDAEQPLPSDAVDRLRDHDDWLCRERPTLCRADGSSRPAAPGGDQR